MHASVNTQSTVNVVPKSLLLEEIDLFTLIRNFLVVFVLIVDIRNVNVASVSTAVTFTFQNLNRKSKTRPRVVISVLLSTSTLCCCGSC